MSSDISPEMREVMICGVQTKVAEWYFQWISYANALSFEEFQAEWRTYEDRQEESPVFSAFWKKKYGEVLCAQ